MLGVLALVRAWGLGLRADEGLVDAGRGALLPLASEGAGPPGWWGSLFLSLADSVHFGSLLFSYAFLWTVAPYWPPHSYLPSQLWAVALGLAGVGARRIWVRALQCARLGGPALRGPP